MNVKTLLLAPTCAPVFNAILTSSGAGAQGKRKKAYTTAGEVAGIDAQMFNFAQKFNRRTAVEFSTEPAILPNCCYVPYFYISLKYSSISVIARSSPFSFLICCLAGIQVVQPLSLPRVALARGCAA